MTEIETGNGEVALTLKRKRIMIYFIEATEKLIRSDGVEGLSIRKIASEAGYNLSLIHISETAAQEAYSRLSKRVNVIIWGLAVLMTLLFLLRLRQIIAGTRDLSGQEGRKDGEI